MKNNNYLFEEFCHDWQKCQEVDEPHSMKGIEWAESYFRKYNDNGYRCSRFVKIMSYIESNLDNIDFGDYSVSGENHSLILNKLIFHIFEHFGNANDEVLNSSPNIKTFINKT